MATLVMLNWFSVASELIAALLEKCTTSDEVEAWTQEEEEVNFDGTIDRIDDYWIAAINGSTWEVQFDEFDFTFSLNNNPDD